MKAWRHPSLGVIEVLPQRLRPRKVWRHLYSRAERWDRVSGEDVEALRREAERVVGVDRNVQRDFPTTLPAARRSRAVKVCARHHDTVYGPAYQSEMAAADTVWTPGVDARYRHGALTPQSVFLVVELGEPSRVVTAFRPHPSTHDVDWTEVGLRRHGVWYFKKETGMNVDELVRAVTENLRRTSSDGVPGSVQELWWLASAVGHGRLLRTHPTVQSHLDAAEEALTRVPEAMSKQLEQCLDWDGCLDRVAIGLKETRPEELEASLAASEELLAVAGAIGATERAMDFCNEVELLVAWVPPEWDHVADRARSRGQAYVGADSPVLRMWDAVQGSVVAALLRETEPARRPEARLVDALIPAERAWEGWLQRIRVLPEKAATAVFEWADRSIGNLRVTAASPLMGSDTTTSAAWEVHCKPESDAPIHRVFIVDDDHPDGQEVTDQFTEFDGFLWQLDRPDDAALVVVVAGKAPLVGGDLDSVLTTAAERDDVVVRAGEAQPTHVTKASR